MTAVVHKASPFLALIFGFSLSVFAGATGRSSTVAISPDGSVLAVVNSDSRSLSLLGLPSGGLLAEIIVGRDPRAVAFNNAGNLAFVTNQFDDSLSVIDVGSVELIQTIPLCDEPAGVVALSDNRVFINCFGDGKVLIFNPGTSSIIGTIPVGAAPMGVAVDSSEHALFISHFFSGQLSVINTATLEIDAVVSTGNDSNIANGIALDPSGGLVWLPHTRSNTGNQALLFDTTVFPVVSAIDPVTFAHKPGLRIHLDVADEPVDMPTDAVVTTARIMFVLNSGSNDISVIDLKDSQTRAHIEVGDNPRGMVLSADESRLFVSNNLTGTVSIIDTNTLQVAGEFRATEVALTRAVLNGKRLFHSSDTPDLSRDQWISCAVCHFGGGMDRRTWFFPDGPRNTTSLLGISETLPVHWSGDLDELQDVEITVRTIQAGTGLAPGADNCDPACDQGPPNAGRSQDLDDLAAFMASLEFPPNPNRLEDGQLSAAASRGKDLFESEPTGCTVCHIPPLYTDHQKHEIGSGNGAGERKGSEFDTPSLRNIYNTAPYLHDGSAETLLDLLTIANPDDEHGQTSHLSEAELSDLIAFLNSIDAESTGFKINAGINDAWLNYNQPGQGFFIVVYPVIGKVFLAWFTYDTVRPDGSLTAQLGESGHRWLTAIGSYAYNRAVLDIEVTKGGLFDASAPIPAQNFDGEIILEFSGCNAGTITYDIPSIKRQGVIAIERIALDNVKLCESLQ